MVRSREMNGMGRNHSCSKKGLTRGAWTAREDKLLSEYIQLHGQGKWRNVALQAGLARSGKSCRVRWFNYLKPDIKRGNISPDEEDLIIRLHKLLGNRWSLIAGRLPGRTNNEIKNYWNTNLRKKIKNGKDNHSIPNYQQHTGRNNDADTNQLLSSDLVSPLKPNMVSHQQYESEAKDCDGTKAKTISSSSMMESSLFESGSNFDILSHDLQDFMLDFQVGELYLPDFFANEFSSVHFINYCDNS